MNLKKRKEEKPMQTKENLSQTVKDVKVEIIKDGEDYIWVWISTHDEYERMIKNI